MTIRQWLIKLFGDAFRKIVPSLPIPTPTPEPDKPVAGQGACTCDLSKPAITSLEDMRAITIDHPHKAECGLQESEGIPLRPVFKSNGHILVLADIYYGKIKRVPGGFEIPCPVSFGGYSWHVVGYGQDDHVEKAAYRFKAGERVYIPKTDTATTFFFIEARK